MLNKIIRFSLHNRILVLLLTAFLIIGGTFVIMNSEIDVFPDLNAPTVVVMTEAPGYAPEEVEKTVTFPIETVVSEILLTRLSICSSSASSCIFRRFAFGEV